MEKTTTILSFEELVVRLSTGFISLQDDELDPAIDHALGEIGDFAGVDRSYVFLFSEDLAWARNSHEWCAADIAPEIDNLQNLPTEAFRWWMVQLGRFDNVYLPDVEDLEYGDDSPRAFLELQGIRSLVAVPLVYRSRLLGFLGFDAVRGPRPWRERDLTLLRLVGDIFANGIQRRRANEALAATERQLREAQKLDSIGRLAGGIAHDFNNILTVVRGFAEILSNKLGPAGAGSQEIQEILAAAARATNLTRQLLAFSRRQPQRREIVDLNSTVLDLRSFLGRLIGEGIRLDTDLEPDLPNVEIDPGHVEQVLLNLVINARDATPPGGRIVIATRTAVDGAEGPRVSLVVRDTGSGVPEEILGRIFDPFFTTKAPGDGTGLGLSVVYGIVRQAEGTIKVESAPGQGSTFEILLPVTGKPRRPADLLAASA